MNQLGLAAEAGADHRHDGQTDAGGKGDPGAHSRSGTKSLSNDTGGAARPRNALDQTEEVRDGLEIVAVVSHRPALFGVQHGACVLNARQQHADHRCRRRDAKSTPTMPPRGSISRRRPGVPSAWRRVPMNRGDEGLQRLAGNNDPDRLRRPRRLCRARGSHSSLRRVQDAEPKDRWWESLTHASSSV